MGIKERVFSPLPREVSLEGLVPKDNFYRRLEEMLDLSFVRDLVRRLYARGGRPSVDPVVFFKLQLVMFFEGLRSERELMRMAAEGIVVVSPDFNVGAATVEEAEVINAAIEYYQYAEVGYYYSTYSLLSYEDQNYYTEDQWVASNNVLDSAAGEFVVTDAYPDDLGLGVPTYAVTVTVYAGDGSSFNRTTYFIDEGGGYWAHYLNEEEINMFDDALY
jgi:hypothetical protein